MTTKSRTTRTPGEHAAAPAGDDITTAPAAPAPSAQDDLPNAIDIDAKAITGPVLTKQGWVCPDDTGRRPLDALKA